MIKKVIFDMDGLIFDSERLFMECLKEEMALYGYLLTEDIYVNTLGLARNDCREYMKAVFGSNYPFDEISDAARKRIAALAQKGLPVKRGIEELLKFLKSRKITCTVASSTETGFIRLYLESAGLLQYFSELVGGETVEKSKPEPDIFLKALGNCEKAEAVIFEDSENGVIAAQRAGIDVICIPDMKRPSDSVLDNVMACLNHAGEAIGMEMFK